jgi:hypothetical protein
MMNIPFFPRPVSWLSAVLIYVFLGLWMTFVAMVAPRLFQLLETSPRLAYLGLLALWTSPIPFVAAGHHVVHAFLDRADSGTKNARGLLPSLGSLWAGVFAWFVIMFASSFCILFLLVLFPPPPEDHALQAVQNILTSFAWPFNDRARAGIHTVAWVVMAAQLYDLERAITDRATRGVV